MKMKNNTRVPERYPDKCPACGRRIHQSHAAIYGECLLCSSKVRPVKTPHIHDYSIAADRVVATLGKDASIEQLTDVLLTLVLTSRELAEEAIQMALDRAGADGAKSVETEN